MGTTNRAEEYACKKYNVKEGLNDYEENHFNSTNVNLAKAFIEGAEYSQSEIDELTKEKSLFIEKYTKSCNEVQKLEKVNDELTKEVERLRKGIDWTRAEYIKCVNDSDEITEKLEELLTTH